VTVVLPDGTSVTVPVVNGSASVDWTVPSDFAAGNYPVNATYNGNEDYLESNGTGVVEVLPLDTTTTAGNVTGKPGENVTIPINVTDANGNPVRDGNVTVVLPDGTSVTVPVVNGSASVDWTVPSDFAAGNYTVDANYNGNDDYNPSENSTEAVISALDTTTVVDPVSGKPGETVPVNVTVTDENGNPVRDGNVTVVLPDGTSVTVTVVNGSASVDWTVPEDYVGDYKANATYEGTDVYNPSNNTGDITIVPLVDVEIHITVDRNSVNYGDVVEFIITVVNNGPSNATNVVVTNVIPEGFVYLANNCSDSNYQDTRDLLLSSIESQSYDASSNTWYIGDLAKGETNSLSILARANYLGTKEVRTSVIATEEESNMGNNVDQVSVTTSGVSDLALIKVVDKTKVTVGDKVTYTFTVTNNGPNDATGVKVVDSILTKYKFVSASSSDYDHSTGTWSIGNLANGSTVTLSVVVVMTEVGEHYNSAYVTGNENDTNTSNNNASSDNVTVEEAPEPIDEPEEPVEDIPAVSEEPKVIMHSAGNPLFMVLLALIGVILPLRRRYL